MTDVFICDYVRTPIGRFVLREKLAALSLDELQAQTGAPLAIEGGVADLVVPEL